MWSAGAGVGVATILCLAALAFASASVGDAAPALVVSELDGQAFDLGALRGKVVIVNFWATWCPPCRAEMPALNAFYQRNHSRGLEMIGVSADRSRHRSDVIKVAQSITYPVAMLDDANTNGFGAPAELPVTYVIDGEGLLRAKFTPDSEVVTEENLNQVVLPLLPNRSTSGVSSAQPTREIQ